MEATIDELREILEWAPFGATHYGSSKPSSTLYFKYNELEPVFEVWMGMAWRSAQGVIGGLHLLSDLRQILELKEQLSSALSFIREVECDDPDCFNGLVADGAGEEAEAHPCLFCKEKRELLGDL